MREHEFEPQPGLPEPLPPGERLLWQGAPDWWALARDTFHIRKVAGYFALLLLWKGYADWYDGASVAESLLGVLKVSPLPLAGLGMLAGLAWGSARTTLYTVTDRRVVMRIGIVLSVTFNLPLCRIAGADLRCEDGDGVGDIALRLADGERIGYAHLWPHVRAWHWKWPQPTLRCLPDAPRVARLLTEVWSAAHGQPVPAAPVQGRSTGRSREVTPIGAPETA